MKNKTLLAELDKEELDNETLKICIFFYRMKIEGKYRIYEQKKLLFKRAKKRKKI